MKVTVEKATLQEISLIVSFLKELYLELGEEAESIRFLDEQFIVEILNSGKTEIYFAKLDEQKVVGILTLTECQSIYAGGKYGLLDEMFIKPEYRSTNIGSLLIDNVQIIGRERNWKRIDVTAPTEDRWKRTVDFYEKCGFVFTGPKLKLKL